MKGRTALSASIMAADKIRPAAVKIGIRLEPSQRFGFHNFRHSHFEKGRASFGRRRAALPASVQGVRVSLGIGLRSDTVIVMTIKYARVTLIALTLGLFNALIDEVAAQTSRQ